MSHQDFLQRQVPGWKDEDHVKLSALFKAFSGQRPDWQHRLDFWKSLIVNLSRHLSLVVIDAHQVQHTWFYHEGLLPLCINDVLHEMLKSGELQAFEDGPPGMHHASRLRWALSSLGNVVTWALGLQAETTDKPVISGKLVVSTLLKEKVSYICKALADSNWKSDCVVTMDTFVDLCGTVDDAKAISNYLAENRRAAHFCLDSEENIEGLKLSLTLRTPVSPPSQLDHHMLQLFWTNEKMKQRLDLLNERVLQLRNGAMACLKIKDKQAALRNLKSMKILSQSREKCADMMAKIHEILDAISQAETNKKVYEAVEVGNVAMRRHHVTLEEVHGKLKQLDESMTLAREVGEALGGGGVEEDDEEVEDEFARLEEEVVKRESEEKGGVKQEVEREEAEMCGEEDKLAESLSKLEICW